MAFHEERDRAESFGQVAQNYDKFRPQYPDVLVDTIVNSSGPAQPRVLDVGSGTGILAAQLREAGCEVVAVEPDPQMAAVAKGKGLHVEISTFEAWDPAGRTFDIVGFGQSFHWVDPDLALPHIAKILNSQGTLALAWNNIQADGEVGTALHSIVEKLIPSPTPSPSPEDTAEDTAGEHPVVRELQSHGFEATELSLEETLNYSRDAWLSMVFTYSAQLTLEPELRDQMFAEMFTTIPDDGLKAHNEAQLILAQPSG